MARLWQSGFELNSTTTDVEFSNVTGAGTSIQSTTVRTGTYALRCNPSAATSFVRYHVFTSNQSTVAYQRVYMRIATLPGANTTIMRFVDVGNNPCAQIRLTSSGTLVLLDAGGTPVGSASSALSTGQWYRLELGLDASASPGAVEARLDGTSFASGANSAQAPWARVLIGPVVSATMDAAFDDWAVNDSSGSAQSSWPGDGKILHLIPNGDGDAHGWSNTSNGVGSSTNYQLVDDTAPPNDATDLVQTGVVNTTDMYTLTDSGIGAGDTVNVVMVGLRLRNNVADATAAVKAQIAKTAGGTITQGSAIVPNTTTWGTNAPAQPRNYTLITYADPDGSAWTQSTLDSAQAGIKLTTAGTNRIQVSALWVSVDCTPSSGTDATVTPSAITAATTFPAASPSAGSTVSPSAVAAAAALPAPGLSTGSTVSPAAVAATASVPAAGLSTGSTVSPAAVSAVVAVPSPAVGAGSAVSPAALAAVVAIPAPSVSAGGDATVTPSAIATTASVPAAILSAGSAAEPAAVAAAASVPAASVSTGSAVSPAAVAAVAQLPAPSVAGSALAAPAAVACTTSLPAAVLSVSSTVLPAAIAAVVSLPAPTVSTAQLMISATAGRPQRAWKAGLPERPWGAGRPARAWRAGSPNL